jgi:ankyrin repeat protein
VNAKNNKGWTTLHLSAGNGKVDAIAALIKAGADVNAECKDQQRQNST